MTSFVNPHFPTEHPGVVRLQAAAAGVRQLRRNFAGGRGLATVLLSAVVAAVAVAADQIMDSVAEGQLLVIWTGAWLAAFAALALLAGPTLRLASSIKSRLDAWSARVAQSRAEKRLWSMAQSDRRVMADLQAAMMRSDD
jgi:hypothetical protein